MKKHVNIIQLYWLHSSLLLLLLSVMKLLLLLSIKNLSAGERIRTMLFGKSKYDPAINGQLVEVYFEYIL